jgi:hypothetical protein
MSLNVFFKKLSDLDVVVVCFFSGFLMKMRKKMKEGDEDGKN